MKHCWFGIAHGQGAFNFGNRLVELYLRELLSLDSEELLIDVYEPISEELLDEINNCDYVVIPGGTLIQRHEHIAMTRIGDVTPPKYCFGGAFFTRLPFPSPQYCSGFQAPVGVRDPFTLKYLKLYGLEAKFVGCPTLFSGSATTWQHRDGPVAFNLGRKNIKQQLVVFDHIRQKYPVEVVIQEKKQKNYFPANTIFVDYENSSDVVNTYANASVVVTGRLHAALPALANGTPVVFSQLVHDSRVSLLKYLGLKIHNPFNPALGKKVINMVGGRTTPPDRIFERAAQLRANFLDFIDWFRRNLPQTAGTGLNTRASFRS